VIDANALTEAELNTLRRGGVICIGNHRYICCAKCRKLVRVTGFLAGWHLCTGEDE
jgi:hypothetical protein